jgi:DNA-binding IclR family transcriptional regulator
MDGAGIQVIARAAAVLRALKDAPAGMSLGAIAGRVGLPRSTVQRIVGALAAERLVTAPGASGGIRLGPGLRMLAEAARFDVAEQVRPLLQELARQTDETVDLSVLRGAALVFIDQIPGTHRLRAVSSVGETFPLTDTANGKACLALAPPVEAERLAREEWQRLGRRRDMASFMTELAETRGRGVAFDRDEHTAGISAVGIAFRDRGGELYAVSIPAPSARFARNEASLANAIRKLRSEIEAQICA